MTPTSLPSRLHPHLAHVPQDLDAERAMLLRAQQGDASARETIVRNNLRLVGAIARNHLRRGIELDDLVSEGVCGLLEAIDRFDVTRENRFATYATYWVRERIGRYARGMRGIVAAPESRMARSVLRRRGRVEAQLVRDLGREPSRIELAAALGVDDGDLAELEPIVRGMNHALDGFEADDPRGQVVSAEEDPETRFAKAEFEACERSRIASALSRLGDRERRIVERRFFEEEETSLTDLGRELGVSRERVRQLQRGAESKLARYLGAA